MKRILPPGLALLLATALTLSADDDLRRYQQALRDQGFFYGQVDGKQSDETSQAIRRFQIRNGLAVSGNLDAATRKAIDGNVDSTAPAAPSAPPLSTPPPARTRPVNPDNPDAPQPSEVIVPPPNKPAKPAPARPAITPPPRGRYENDPPGGPASRPPAGGPPPEVSPGPGGQRPIDEIRRPGEAGGGEFGGGGGRAPSPIFIGGPYENAPPFVQGSIAGRVQVALGQRGFYRGETSGRVGPQTQQAVRDFQASTGLRMSGRLDAPTLRALGIEFPTYEPLNPGAGAERPPRRAPRGQDSRYLGSGVYEGRIVEPGR